MKALIVGAGIHGLTIACEIAKLGIKTTIIDEKYEILLGTSNGTHNRVNMGYHYPRSIETAEECHKGFEYFKKNLPSALYYPIACYYAIDSNSSLITAKQYRDFLNAVDLKYSLEQPHDNLLIADCIEDCFKVWEPCYDVQLLRRIFHQKIENFDIDLILGFKIVKAEIHDKSVNLTSFAGHILTDNFDIIINATYALTNNLQEIFGCNELKKTYIYQKTEVVVTSYEKQILPAITVMDGPFITVLPYTNGGHKQEYVVYDVVNSIHAEMIGSIATEDFLNSSHVSKYESMKAHGEKYFSFMKDLKPKTSLWAFRPIPLTTLNDDSRITNWIKHDNHKNFYSILEGKFVSAPLQAEIMCKDIMNGFCK
jgi:hypothetical protein